MRPRVDRGAGAGGEVMNASVPDRSDGTGPQTSGPAELSTGGTPLPRPTGGRQPG